MLYFSKFQIRDGLTLYIYSERNWAFFLSLKKLLDTILNMHTYISAIYPEMVFHKEGRP